MSVKIGLYQSVAYPNIMRKVVRVSNGMVVYSIIDANKPDAQFCKMATGAENPRAGNSCTASPTRRNPHAIKTRWERVLSVWTDAVRRSRWSAPAANSASFCRASRA